MRSGSTSPVTAYPNLISGSRTVWPPRSAHPASTSFSAPPRTIAAAHSTGKSRSGKAAIESAVSGRPPIA